MPNEKEAKKSQKFHCETCDFHTCKKSNWKKHLETRKHKILTNPNLDTPRKYECICGKVYKHQSSLIGHKKKKNCVNNESISKMDT